MTDQFPVGALGAASAPLDDALLLRLWRSVQGPNAGLTGPLIRFAALVRALPSAPSSAPNVWVALNGQGQIVGVYSTKEAADLNSDYVACCRLNSAPSSAPAWQPIETAPKDGTWILCFGKLWTLPNLAQWSRSRNCWQDMDHALWQVTHWMPLPDPPSSAPQEQE